MGVFFLCTRGGDGDMQDDGNWTRTTGHRITAGAPSHDCGQQHQFVVMWTQIYRVSTRDTRSSKDLLWSGRVQASSHPWERYRTMMDRLILILLATWRMINSVSFKSPKTGKNLRLIPSLVQRRSIESTWRSRSDKIIITEVSKLLSCKTINLHSHKAGNHKSRWFETMKERAWRRKVLLCPSRRIWHLFPKT